MNNAGSAPTPHEPDTRPGSTDHLRFHKRHAHLSSTFGNDAFALKAEAFARFFGTPAFLGAQTIVVVLWVVLNATGVVQFDLYPFILLNLAFSLQSAYAAPLILLAQTRQSARDKANADADALHREYIASQMLSLLEQNTQLTELTKALTERIESLTLDMHKHFVKREPR
jgi:uncharacterized membrane protein